MKEETTTTLILTPADVKAAVRYYLKDYTPKYKSNHTTEITLEIADDFPDVAHYPALGDIEIHVKTQQKGEEL